jgi:methylmalonyl-CoA/ethylmalonyl-CoA epimerase
VRMSGKSLLSHIGIAVADLDQSVAVYRQLLGEDGPLITEVADQKVRVAVFGGGHGVGGGKIELLAASAPDSPIARFIEKRGEGLHHICLYVDDLDRTLKALRDDGVRLIDDKPRVGAEGTRIAFIHPSSTSGVLVELEERLK